MPNERRLYMGPSLRRLRRDLGLTQADMAADLEVSASYIALLERNHRPLSAEILVRLAETYKVDVAALAGKGGSDDSARLQAVLKDPMFADLDLPALETTDVATNFPGVMEAMLRLLMTPPSASPKPSPAMAAWSTI
jgi:transcriptional regulator with XRE-family HTH domain